MGSRFWLLCLLGLWFRGRGLMGTTAAAPDATPGVGLVAVVVAVATVAVAAEFSRRFYTLDSAGIASR